jgi:hypothetical protein
MQAFGLGIWRPHLTSPNPKSTPNFHFQICVRSNSYKENNLSGF